MCTVVVPHDDWEEFLRSFSSRHSGWLVRLETHDLETGETVATRFARLGSVQLDLEDVHNQRINVVVHDDLKEIKHIFFQPSDLTLQISRDGNEEGLRIVSVNTVTTVRFRVAAPPETVDDVA
jgi:hypothetical protein